MPWSGLVPCVVYLHLLILCAVTTHAGARLTGDGAVVEGDGMETEVEPPASLDRVVPGEVAAVQSDMLDDAAPHADSLPQVHVINLCVGVGCRASRSRVLCQGAVLCRKRGGGRSKIRARAVDRESACQETRGRTITPHAALAHLPPNHTRACPRLLRLLSPPLSRRAPGGRRWGRRGVR